MGKRNWLVFTHAANHRDHVLAGEAIDHMQDNLDADTNVFSIYFGPTLKSVATLTHIRHDERLLIAALPNESVDTALANTCEFTKTLHKLLWELSERIEGVCVWSHGSGGSGIGVWKRWKMPFMSCVDLVRTVIRPFKPRIVCFDACYQGSMSCLYELVGATDVVVASPGFHPYCSLLWTAAFGELSKVGHRKRDFEKYAHEIACQWHAMTAVYYKCLLVFDMAVIPDVAAAIKQHWDELVFDDRSQIDQEDPNLHDVSIAFRNNPSIQNLIEKSISQYTRHCLKCRGTCTRWVNGPSMEARLLRKWQAPYTQTAWYRHIRGKPGFHDARLISSHRQICTLLAPDKAFVSVSALRSFEARSDSRLVAMVNQNQVQIRRGTHGR
ncbi:hypothetical protein AXG93_3661s1050 [Marchantia polymorpha subsp. ruderalis]|uniref:Uncharacterized protein n=1 Tax=Marchantia polymorpha subsp. ruderalis TaxID=1480154 RepID=A0A176VJM5_MARPO|nr:hypothetical protein AXG93_3661s1050 [Marchantia polymorpha subsp. ruderalis]